MRREHVVTATFLAVTAALGLTACGAGSSGAVPAASPGVGSSGSANTTETNPPGDIPDSQAYVRYTPQGQHFSVKIPEGWARSTHGTSTTFTSKLNSVTIDASSAGSAPTVAGVQAGLLAKLRATVPKFQPGRTSTLTRGGQQVVRVTYQGDSAPDKVTGKVVRNAYETYLYYHSGTLLKLTLAGPSSADNVDPWRTVSDSVRWH